MTESLRHRQSPPMPRYGGHAMTWEDRGPAPRVLCTKAAQACAACASVRPPIIHVGVQHPLPDETVDDIRMVRTRSGREYGRRERRPAHAFLRLLVLTCPNCGRVDYYDEVDPSAVIAEILCDGCDRVIAAGADHAEAEASARAMCAVLGDGVDLCAACSPGVAPIWRAP